MIWIIVCGLPFLVAVLMGLTIIVTGELSPKAFAYTTTVVMIVGALVAGILHGTTQVLGH